MNAEQRMDTSDQWLLLLREKAGDGSTDEFIHLRQHDLLRLLGAYRGTIEALDSAAFDLELVAGWFKGIDGGKVKRVEIMALAARTVLAATDRAFLDETMIG